MRKAVMMKNVKIFTDVIEPIAINQVYELANHPAFQDCKIRIMPDAHSGKGCVIGFTADIRDKVIPNIVGVDIGCGMLCMNLGPIDLDLQKLDEIIRKYVPSGNAVHDMRINKFDKLQSLLCYRELKDTKRIERSIGTLGGGNHFIEVDIDDEGNKYLIIHSGSRNLGKQVAEYYQNLAISVMSGKSDLNQKKQKLIDEYTKQGKQREIQEALIELGLQHKEQTGGIPNELCYLTGRMREQYLHDMKICQEYASLNRKAMQLTILEHLGIYKYYDEFETIHNYIEHDTNIVRKGAISAKDGEKLLIPINMRDGCILGSGKGNGDWNQSAPHGAGRLMSRSVAKENISLEEFKESMQGIYTTSVNQSTIDESPMAYKRLEDIVDKIGDTVDILKILKPIYNFKASE